jgi:hypothetical protein
VIRQDCGTWQERSLEISPEVGLVRVLESLSGTIIAVAGLPGQSRASGIKNQLGSPDLLLSPAKKDLPLAMAGRKNKPPKKHRKGDSAKQAGQGRVIPVK